MSQPRVTIIVPVYKTPIILLKRFLNSALTQTFENIELIAVDDASPDQCPEVLDEIAETDSRMNVLHKKINGRAGKARGDGLSIAKGEYILFVDADDIMHPDMCEKLVGLAEESDADIVSSSWSIVDDKGNLTGRGCYTDQILNLKHNYYRAKAYRIMNYALWNKLFRYDTIKDLKFEQFEANIGEDTLFNISALCQSSRVVTTSYCGYDYIVHTASATGRDGKGMPYLETLVKSGTRISQTILAVDQSREGKQFADLITLKRFNTGCVWIAEHPDQAAQAVMWDYWKKYLHNQILPNLNSRKVLGLWYRQWIKCRNLPLICRMNRLANKIADPLDYMDKIAAEKAVNRKLKDIK